MYFSAREPSISMVARISYLVVPVRIYSGFATPARGVAHIPIRDSV